MKVLQLCLRVPFPPADGGSIAMHSMSTGLQQSGIDVKVVALNTFKHHVDISQLPQWYREAYNIETCDVDTKVELIPAFLNLFQSGSYNIERFNKPEFHKLLADLLLSDDYDIVQLESLFMTPYLDTIKKNSSAKIVLRSHNIENQIWHRLSGYEKNIFKKCYFSFLAKRLNMYEHAVVNDYDGILTLTKEDEKQYHMMGCRKKMEVVPIGLDISKYPHKTNFDKINYFHLGSMDWLPNYEAVKWFLDHVHPLIVASGMKLPIFLAGKKMQVEFKSLETDFLVVNAQIDDAISYMDSKQVMIVPLLSGGGMRVKILEGMAMGKAVISTSIGAEGIGYTNNKNIIIADTPAQFSEAMLKCYSDPGYCKYIGENARTLVENLYSAKAIGSQVSQFYSELLK